MKSKTRELIESGDRLFSARSGLVTHWQDIAENFYPERADFTFSRWIGQDYAANLMTSYPVLARRTLGDQFASMLRPRSKPWYKMKPEDDRLDDNRNANAWLEAKTLTMRRVMYAPQARFLRATKEGDHDYAAFGQCVITVELAKSREDLIYRTWHLRDVVWAENAEGNIDTIHRKWKLAARGVKALWPETCGPTVNQLCEREGHKEINLRHIIVPSSEYEHSSGKKRSDRLPVMSIYVDADNDHILEETALHDHPYVIPRWQTVSGSQYAHSPATVVALPDSRLLQRMTLTLLEAGEKAVNPPMVATKEVIRSDIQVYAGGVTMVDMDYDERLGEALRVLDTGARGGLAFGADIAGKYEALIKEAFYLDKINLPPVTGGDMTATEVRARIEEYIRAALPLFEPVETDYSAPLCEKTFDLCLRNGAFGPITEMPRELGGMEIKFQFESPISQSAEREKVAQFRETAALLKEAAEMDPTLLAEFDVRTAFRDAVSGVGGPSKWLLPEEEAAKARAAEQEKMAMARAAEQAGAMGGIAEQVGAGAQQLQAAGIVPGPEQVAA